MTDYAGPREHSIAGADLLVSSDPTNSVLRYDQTTGAFLGAFVTSGSGGLTLAGGRKRNLLSFRRPETHAVGPGPSFGVITRRGEAV